MAPQISLPSPPVKRFGEALPELGRECLFGLNNAFTRFSVGDVVTGDFLGAFSTLAGDVEMEELELHQGHQQIVPGNIAIDRSRRSRPLSPSVSGYHTHQKVSQYLISPIYGLVERLDFC